MLRAPSADLENIPAALAAGREAASDVHGHRALRNLNDADFLAAEKLIGDLQAALAPLRGQKGEAPLVDFIAAHRAALETLVAPKDLADSREGEIIEEIFAEWRHAAEGGFALKLSDYAALFDSLMAGKRAPAPSGAHPRLKILVSSKRGC